MTDLEFTRNALEVLMRELGPDGLASLGASGNLQPLGTKPVLDTSANDRHRSYSPSGREKHVIVWPPASECDRNCSNRRRSMGRCSVGCITSIAW